MEVNKRSNSLLAIWPTHSKYASITWQVSDVCNYKCSYCNPGNFGATNRNLSTDLYIENLRELVKSFITIGLEVFNKFSTDLYIENLRELVKNFKANGYEAFRFFFSGGEPTIWPPFIPILEYIRSEIPGALVAVNTNLSRPLEWWQQHYTLFNDIVASFHIEYCNKETYMQNMKFLQDKMDYIVCRMLMHDSRFEEVVSFADTLKENLSNYFIEYAALFEALSPHSEMHFYQEEWKRNFLKENTIHQQRLLPKVEGVPATSPAYCEEHYADGSVRPHNSNRVVSEDMNIFKGWKCWINDAIFITPTGDIRVASCDMGNIIGNMNKRDLNFSSRPVICNQARCNCGTDIGIRKAHPSFPLLKAANND